MSVIRAKGIVFGTGRLTKNADTRFVGDKKSKKVNLGIAVNKKGEPPEYVNGVCWGDVADYAERLVKGDRVFFFGEDQPEREYNGKKYKDTDIFFLSKQPVGVFGYGDANDSNLTGQPADFGDEVPEEKMPWDD
jgi:hypothetical protein